LIVGASANGIQPPLLFTENESNAPRLWNPGAKGAFAKDAFHEYVVRGQPEAVKAQGVGTQAAAHYIFNIPAGASQTVKLRLFAENEAPTPPLGALFDQIFEARIREANEFYSSIGPVKLSREQRNVVRQGYAGLLWSKQFYHYIVQDWLNG